MTATVSLSPTRQDRFSPSSPISASLRPTPALPDGARWPRSRDLGVQLPVPAAVLGPLRGRITRAAVRPTHGPAVPRDVPVDGHVVKAARFPAEQDPHELLLLSCRSGRWNLLVVPPRSDPASAARPMAAASDPLRTSTASRLLDQAAHVRTAKETDGCREAVRDSEGGRGARDPARTPGRE